MDIGTSKGHLNEVGVNIQQFVVDAVQNSDILLTIAVQRAQGLLETLIQPLISRF